MTKESERQLDEIREIVNEYLQIEICEVGKTLINDLLTVLEFSETKGNSG